MRRIARSLRQEKSGLPRRSRIREGAPAPLFRAWLGLGSRKTTHRSGVEAFLTTFFLPMPTASLPSAPWHLRTLEEVHSCSTSPVSLAYSAHPCSRSYRPSEVAPQLDNCSYPPPPPPFIGASLFPSLRKMTIRPWPLVVGRVLREDRPGGDAAEAAHALAALDPDVPPVADINDDSESGPVAAAATMDVRYRSLARLHLPLAPRGAPRVLDDPAATMTSSVLVCHAGWPPPLLAYQ